MKNVKKTGLCKLLLNCSQYLLDLHSIRSSLHLEIGLSGYEE